MIAIIGGGIYSALTGSIVGGAEKQQALILKKLYQEH